MAEQVEANVQENEVQEAEIVKWDELIALNRFLWMQSLEPYHSTAPTCGVDKNEIKKVMHTMANPDEKPDQLFTYLKLALQSKSSLPSLETSLWCLAVIIRQGQNQDLIKNIRESFNQLVTTPSDLLSFVYSYSMSGNEKLSFGRSMRNCLSHWYSARSPSELLELLFASEKFKAIGHVDIVMKLHLKVDNEDKNEIIKATRMKYDEIKTGADKSTFMKKILKYRDLKRCQEVHEVVSILKRKDFVYKLNHVPKFALKSTEVIELVVPNMSLAELIDQLLDFANRKILKSQEPVYKLICNALSVTNKVTKEAHINPFNVFQIMKTLEKKLTTEGGAIEIGQLDKSKKSSNPFIIKKLHNIFQQSLKQTKTGCRYFITLDLRKFSKRQSNVNGMKNVHPSEVQVIFALTMLKTEKEVTIMSFTDDRNKLKPVAWTSETSYEKAMEIFEADIKEKPKTKENILLPLRKAGEDKKKVDVFVTFVSSIARTCGKKAKPPLEDLQKYRSSSKLVMAKLVVVNLSRQSADFNFEKKDESETGILEIVGFHPDSLRVIEGFAKNSFV